MMRRASFAAFALCAAGLVSAADNTWVRVKGGWEPTPIVLNDLKAKLEPFAKNAAQIQGRKLRNWSEYVFQYQGQETKGNKYILVNALCRNLGNSDLEKEMVLVLDGGTCYFNAKYDPRRGHYYDLLINGDA